VGQVTYLDHAATTPLRPEVAEAMAEVRAEPLGNPTGSHPPAQRARQLLEEARDDVAAFVGCQPGEVVFTSGGTESANLAVFGSLAAAAAVAAAVAVAAAAAGAGRPLLCHSAVEHPAVLESCRAAAHQGADVRVVAVDGAGRVDLDDLADALDAEPLLVAVMAANNETGVVQPLAEVVAMVRDRCPGAGVFTDAVQAAAFLDLAEATAGADLVGISAHKVGGPVGAGALIVRAPWPLAAHQHGGGQERERRSGTQDVAGAVGLATALRLAAAERAQLVRRVASLRDQFADGLSGAIDGVQRTVPPGVETLPGHLHLCLRGIEREELLVALGREGVCASGGSSCASGALEDSHVLAAMGVSGDLARGAIRFTLGHGTSEDDIERALAVVPGVVQSLRHGV
jgi:cysteine desulfurase